MDTNILDQELEQFQNTKGDPVPIEQDNSSEMSEPFKKKLKEYSAFYLSKYNEYLKAKAEADRLKTESDAAECSLIAFANSIGADSNATIFTFEGMGKFTLKESYFGNVTSNNVEQVYHFFKGQKRERDFFQLGVRKAKINEYVREKVKTAEENGGDVKSLIPNGITVSRKQSISISKRNTEYTYKKGE